MEKVRNNFFKILVAFSIIVALMGVVFMFAACEEGNQQQNQSIAGTYTYISVDIQTVENEEPWMQAAAETSKITFAENKTGSFLFQDVESTFSYSRTGNNITVSIIFKNERKIWYGVLDDNKITMGVRFNAYFMMEIVYKKVAD